jgi:hypothetical protein
MQGFRKKLQNQSTSALRLKRAEKNLFAIATKVPGNGKLSLILQNIM